MTAEPGAEEWHGTLTGDRRGCRCEPCRGAKSAANKARHERFKVWLADLKDQPCTDCGNRFATVCMHFDHRDPSIKSFEISSSAMRSRTALVAEIAKCDIVCANCHSLRTAAQRADGILTPGRPRHP